MYPFSPKLPSHPGCHIMLSRVGEAIFLNHDHSMSQTWKPRKTQRVQGTKRRSVQPSLVSKPRQLPQSSSRSHNAPTSLIKEINRGLDNSHISIIHKVCQHIHYKTRMSLAILECWLNGVWTPLTAIISAQNKQLIN